MCAQIEREPREGVEIYDSSEAPTTPVSFVELLICDVVTLGALLMGVWAVTERVWEWAR